MYSCTFLACRETNKRKTTADLSVDRLSDVGGGVGRGRGWPLVL